MQDDNQVSPIVLAALFFALVVVSWLSVLAQVPTWWSPYPVLQVFLVTSGLPQWLALAVLPLVFLALHVIPVIKPYKGRMWHLAVPMALLTIVTLVVFTLNFQMGVIRHGLFYTVFLAAMNALILSFFWIKWAAWRNAASSRRLITLGFVVFIWLSWFAFPYLWEGI